RTHLARWHRGRLGDIRWVRTPQQGVSGARLHPHASGDARLRRVRDRDHRPPPTRSIAARAGVRSGRHENAFMSSTGGSTADAVAPGTGAVANIIVDGRPIPFRAGDTVAMAIMRAGEHPHHGGTICLAGDCPNCVADVDGTAYVRTCQTAARPGLVI